MLYGETPYKRRVKLARHAVREWFLNANHVIDPPLDIRLIANDTDTWSEVTSMVEDGRNPELLVGPVRACADASSTMHFFHKMQPTR